MNHRVGRLVFGFAVGLMVASFSYRWIADNGPSPRRQQEDAAILESRNLLENTLNIGQLVIVDPTSPDRKVGKAYVFPVGNGWEVSGYYRRNENDLWHPYLVSMDAALALRHLKISDTRLLDRNGQGRLEVLP